MPRWVTRVIIVSAIVNTVASAQQDPTRPSSYGVNSNDSVIQDYSTGLVVDAIFVRNSSRVAIINGIPVSVGEQQFGAKLIAINSDSVIVEQVIDGISQQRTIGVNSMGEVKKNATNNF